MARHYKNLFQGKGNEQDAQVVLADLAAYAEFYATLPAPPLSTPERLVDHNARRDVFSRVLALVGLTDEEMQALENATKLEHKTDVEEGMISDLQLLKDDKGNVYWN